MYHRIQKTKFFFLCSYNLTRVLCKKFSYDICVINYLEFVDESLLRSEIFDNRYAVLSNAPFLRCEFPNRNRL
ncbi:hypothetical protein BWD12_00855 [Leptospira santarosai serovar Bananal]|nr:hypothetical protein BWD11_16460 [Leptospira santarosai serovar Grippotyphosa]ONF81492.1 hypothetical protein BWD12_00855 [Leptospira santarosai serovar Bananal]